MHRISNSHQRPVVADLHQPVKLQFPATLARMSQIVDLVTSAVTAAYCSFLGVKNIKPHKLN